MNTRNIHSLGDICDIYQPKTISTEMLCPDGKYLVYGANGVIGRYNQYNHEDSEVLMTCRGATCGTINVSEPLSWINGNAMVIHPKTYNTFSSRSFLVYLLKSLDLSLVITGCAQPQITRQSLSPLKVYVPPLAEQERIVAELDLLSGIIDKQKAQLKELDNLAQSIFYDMFGDMEHNERGWVIGTIGQHIRLQGGFAFKSKDYCSEGVKLIQIANVNKDFVNWDIVVNLPNNYCQKYSSFSLIEGDILMAMTRPVIKSLNSVKIVEVRKLDMPCLLNQRVGRFIIDEKHFDKKWFVHYCKQDYFKQEVIKYSENSIQPNISSKEVEGFAIMIPPLDLQKEFSSKLRAIESLKESINKSIAESQKLFDYTMDKHFG